MELSLRISEFMNTDFNTVNQEDSMSSAVELLMEKGLIGLMVVDDQDKLVGVLSEKECLKILIHQVYHAMPYGKVKEYMQTDFQTISSDMTISTLCGLFRTQEFRRYPVVDSGKIVGQVTRRMVLKTLHEGLFYQIWSGT